MNNKAFFVDKDGNEIFNEEIGSHVALAIDIIENNEKLKKEYEKDKNKGMSTANFLQDICGYMRGSEFGEYKIIIFNSHTISESQRIALRVYHEEGYHFTDSYLEELKNETNNREDDKER